MIPRELTGCGFIICAAVGIAVVLGLQLLFGVRP